MPAKERTFQAAPALTENLRVSLAHCARAFQDKPDLITRALTDPYTRREMTQLVNDLFSLVEVIEQGH